MQKFVKQIEAAKTKLNNFHKDRATTDEDIKKLKGELSQEEENLNLLLKGTEASADDIVTKRQRISALDNRIDALGTKRKGLDGNREISIKREIQKARGAYAECMDDQLSKCPEMEKIKPIIRKLKAHFIVAYDGHFASDDWFVNCPLNADADEKDLDLARKALLVD